MKRFRLFLAVIATALVIVLNPSEANAAPKKQDAVSSLVAGIPTNLVVKQSATLNDGRQVTIYYKKTGDMCEVYSEDNLKGYEYSDLLNLSSTSFSIATSAKGTKIYNCTLTQARKIIKRLVNTYL